MKKIFYKSIDGKSVFFDGILRKHDVQILNPSEKDILADGWKEWTAPSVTANDTEELAYDDIVDALIRERYSISQEFAILRQRDTKPEEYIEYYDYCEKCKQIAKEKYHEED